MKDLENIKIDLAKALRTSGYLLPTEESEIEAFERNLEKDPNKPKDWENPLNIIVRGKIKNVKLKKFDISETSIENLSMAAREGRDISVDVRKKMNEDRKKSK